jgi:hypothetical protein
MSSMWETASSCHSDIAEGGQAWESWESHVGDKAHARGLRKSCNRTHGMGLEITWLRKVQNMCTNAGVLGQAGMPAK